MTFFFDVTPLIAIIAVVGFAILYAIGYVVFAIFKYHVFVPLKHWKTGLKLYRFAKQAYSGEADAKIFMYFAASNQVKELRAKNNVLS